VASERVRTALLTIAVLPNGSGPSLLNLEGYRMCSVRTRFIVNNNIATRRKTALIGVIGHCICFDRQQVVAGELARRLIWSCD
jgi:hypothetical protein